MMLVNQLIFGYAFIPVMTSLVAATVRMLVRDQVQSLHAGQSLELSCEFYMEDFDLFNNPILWRKIQRNEEMNINIMGNIMQPFIGTGRFTVTFIKTPPRYRLVLNIADVALEDYGNYTCEVRGPHTTTLASLTHYIFVKSPVSSITISDQNRTITHTDIQRALVFTEGDYGSLHCVSQGGCPPPEMTIYLGKHEITSQFSLDYTSELSGVMGLRLIEHQTERWTNRFSVTAEYDNRRLQCIVTVPGLGSNISTVKIIVNYAPIVTCETKHTYVGDKNVFLRCEVRARPAAHSMFWILDDNETTLIEGQLRNEYWIVKMDPTTEGMLETRLYLKEAKPDTFRKYTLVSANRIGTTSHQVSLVKKYKSSSSQQSEKHTTNTDSSKKEVQEYHHFLSPANSVTSHSSHKTCLMYLIVLCSFTMKYFST